AGSTLYGVFDVLGARPSLPGTATAPGPGFRVELVGEAQGRLELAGGVPVEVRQPVDAVRTTDIVIVPSVWLPAEGWRKGRYPRLLEWLHAMHERGAMLCSACSGLFLLAETGLFDGRDATVHFRYAREFSQAYPSLPIHPER